MKKNKNGRATVWGESRRLFWGPDSCGKAASRIVPDAPGKRAMEEPGKRRNPEEKKHTEDLVFKAAGEYFGKEALRLFRIPGRMRRAAPTEMIRLEARRMYEDFNFEMESGDWLHFEFESDRIQKKDLRRFREYEAVTGNVYQVDVVTCVICTAKTKVMQSSMRGGINTYRVKVLRLNQRSADRLFERLAKIPKEKISREDMLAIVFCPLTAGKMSMTERFRRGFAYLNALHENADMEEGKKMQAMLYLFAAKFLTKEELKEIKEEISMTVLGQMLMDDGIQKGMQKGVILFAALAKRLLQDGRQRDLERAVEDDKVREQLCREYGLLEEET